MFLVLLHISSAFLALSEMSHAMTPPDNRRRGTRCQAYRYKRGEGDGLKQRTTFLALTDDSYSAHFSWSWRFFLREQSNRCCAPVAAPGHEFVVEGERSVGV